MGLFVLWYVLQKLHVPGIPLSPTAAFLGVLSWGVAMICDYLSKERMLVMYSFIPAGDYKNEKRLVGVLIGVGNICLAFYGYFAGWKA